MATIAQIVEQIRTAIFGKDVRENIAEGIEKCYSDVSTAETLANNAITSAELAVTRANTAVTRANTAVTTANEASEEAYAAAEVAYDAAGDITDFTNCFVQTRNLFDTSKAVANRYVDIDTGELRSNNSYIASDYIPVIAGRRYTVSTTTPNATASATRYAFYNSNKVFIQNSGTSNVWTVQAPSGAAYLRFSIYANRENVMIENASNATEYVPYGKQLIETFPLELPNARFGYGSDVTRGTNIAPDITSFTSSDGAYYDSVNAEWVIAANQSIQTNVDVTNGVLYYIYWTLDTEEVQYTMHMPNSLTISLGNVSAQVFWAPDATNRVALMADSSGTKVLKLKMAPTASGTIKTVRCMPYTQYASELLELNGQKVRSFRDNISIGGGLEKSMSANNTSLGSHAQESLDVGQNNTAVGYLAQQALTAGSYNTAYGNRAQNHLVSGMYNVGIGHLAQYELTSGCWNVALGIETQAFGTTGCNNVSLGRRVHNHITTGSNNVGVGALAGFHNGDAGGTMCQTTTACFQTTVGFNATQKYSMNSEEQCDYATAFGAYARAGENATALGPKSAAIGSGSVAIGMDSTGVAAQANNDNQVVIGTSAHSIYLAGHKINFNQNGTVTWE